MGDTIANALASKTMVADAMGWATRTATNALLNKAVSSATKKVVETITKTGEKAPVQSPTTVSTPVGSGSGTFLMKKRGRGTKQGLWAVGQHDKKRKYIGKEMGRDFTFIIRQAIGCYKFQLPMQPFKTDSCFQELFPNGICARSTVNGVSETFPNDNLTDNSNTSHSWGRTTEAFTSEGIQIMPEDRADGKTAPSTRGYTDDEIEWPYITVIENRLRLVTRPGNKAQVIRLLVIQFLDDQMATETARTPGTVKVGDFFSKPFHPKSVNGVQHNLPINAMMNTTMERTNTRLPRWRVLTDQTWTSAPASPVDVQIPNMLEISKPHSNITLRIADEDPYAEAVVMGKGRIIWGLFYENPYGTSAVSPDQTLVNDTYPSYYGHYKFKWKLQD